MKLCICRRQHGSAVIVVLALLAILFAYLSFNALTLQRLSREVKAVEKRQLSRLQTSASSQSAPPLTNAPERRLPNPGSSQH
jgi:hypothetical protein